MPSVNSITNLWPPLEPHLPSTPLPLAALLEELGEAHIHGRREHRLVLLFYLVQVSPKEELVAGGGREELLIATALRQEQLSFAIVPNGREVVIWGESGEDIHDSELSQVDCLTLGAATTGGVLR